MKSPENTTTGHAKSPENNRLNAHTMAQRDDAAARKALIRTYDAIVTRTSHADDERYQREWVKLNGQIKKEKVALEGKRKHVDSYTPKSKECKAVLADAESQLQEMKSNCPDVIEDFDAFVEELALTTKDGVGIEEMQQLYDLLGAKLRHAKACREEQIIRTELTISKQARDSLEQSCDELCRRIDRVLKHFGRRQEAVRAGESDLPVFADMSTDGGSYRSSRSSRGSRDHRRSRSRSPRSRSMSSRKNSRRGRSRSSERSSKRSSSSGGSRKIRRSLTQTVLEVKRESMQALRQEFERIIDMTRDPRRLSDKEWRSIDEVRTKYSITEQDFIETLSRFDWTYAQWTARHRILCTQCSGPLVERSMRSGESVRDFADSVCAECKPDFVERYKGFSFSKGK